MNTFDTGQDPKLNPSKTEVSGLSPKTNLFPGRTVPIGGHVLPPLPYPYDALEPQISRETLRLHHDRHHLAYVNGLNRAEMEVAAARQARDFSLIRFWETELAFNGSGHILHSIYWTNMTPRGGEAPGPFVSGPA